MRRTQIYLTDEERKALRVIADRLGRSQSEVIRAAVDHYIVRYQAGNRLDLLRQARGIWKERADLPDFLAIRNEFDRNINDAS
ncbi:MAG: CopG family transcriptional regulator [Anaerolineales bacterium]|nr:CopG family transcriptional regulator [Anaerolineales bacterium]